MHVISHRSHRSVSRNLKQPIYLDHLHQSNSLGWKLKFFSRTGSFFFPRKRKYLDLGFKMSLMYQGDKLYWLRIWNFSHLYVASSLSFQWWVFIKQIPHDSLTFGKTHVCFWNSFHLGEHQATSLLGVSTEAWPGHWITSSFWYCTARRGVVVVVFKPLGKSWETWKNLFLWEDPRQLESNFFFAFFLFEALVVERCLVVSPQKSQDFHDSIDHLPPAFL